MRTAKTPFGKRLIAGLAAVAVLGSGLAGCATAGSSSPTTTASTSVSTTSTTIEGVSSGSYTATFDGKSVTINAAYLIDGTSVTIDSGTYASLTADQVVFLVVNGGTLTITNATITKAGDASASSAQNSGDVSDDYNFYGLNSAILVVGEGSSAKVIGSTITTTSSGSNAVVSTLAGSASVVDTTITTSGNSARGLHATYEGTITGEDLTITTTGAHSAALATDRGSGTVTVTGTNTFNTSGDGSPLLYSTGTISASGVTGTASGAEAVVVEGKNSATLTDSKVTAKGSNAVMVYQSFSGDAADADAAASTSSLVLKDTTINYTGTGALLYFTNTAAKVTLSASSFVSNTASALASAAENRWGTSGSNGATVTIEVVNSTLSGKVSAGDSSSIALSLTDSSKVSGATTGSVTVKTDSTSSRSS